jgi:3-mercaptopyruvate sulfurtransferase SseA
MRSIGFAQVRPLEGGLDAWRERGYPVVTAEELPASAHGFVGAR